MKVAVVGTGYVGLVLGTCLADSGNEVACVDIDAKKVARLSAGEVPIYEPGLEDLFRRSLKEKRLRFTTDLAAAVAPAEVVFIAVGTPQSEDGSADLTAVLAVAKQIAPQIESYKVVVLKSTVPVGTNARVREVLSSGARGPFDVVSNPEFLKEGAAVEDFLKPDRVVIGTRSERARKLMGELYGTFVRTGKPILFMDPASAEMTKYAANAMLATKISFMNEVAHLCEAVGADVEDVRRGIGTDSRIGFPFIFPGLGFGGSCFPKDVRALIKLGELEGAPQAISKAVVEVNEDVRARFVDRIVSTYGDVKGLTFAVWGLAFKPKTDDMREAPAVTIIERLAKAGAKLVAFDPVAMPVAKDILGNKVKLVDNLYDAVRGADGLILVTEWNEFRRPDFAQVRSLMKRAVVFDGRNVWEPEKMVASGFEYYGIGRTLDAPVAVAASAT